MDSPLLEVFKENLDQCAFLVITPASWGDFPLLEDPFSSHPPNFLQIIKEFVVLPGFGLGWWLNSPWILFFFFGSAFWSTDQFFIKKYFQFLIVSHAKLLWSWVGLKLNGCINKWIFKRKCSIVLNVMQSFSFKTVLGHLQYKKSGSYNDAL